MLRLKPSRIALTDDDLCYHLDSIFTQHDGLADWHRRSTGFSNGYDGDDSDDELFLNSDSFLSSEVASESDCEDSRFEALAEDSRQGASMRQRNKSPSNGSSDSAASDILSLPDCPGPVDCILSAHSLSNSQLSPQLIVNPQRALLLGYQQQHSTCSGESGTVRLHNHPLPSALHLPFPPNSSWRGLRELFARPQILAVSRSLCGPDSGSSQPNGVVLDSCLASPFVSSPGLPVRFSLHKGTSKQSENSRKTFAPPTRADLDLWPRLKLRLSPVVNYLALPSSDSLDTLFTGQGARSRPKMKRTRDPESPSPARDRRRPAFQTPEPSSQEDPTEIVHISARAAERISVPQTPRSRSVCVTAVRDTQEENIRNNQLALGSIASRAIQTAQNMAPHMPADVGAIGHLVPDYPPLGHGNDILTLDDIPIGATADIPEQLLARDDFMETVFPEPLASPYNAPGRMRRATQGSVNPTMRRGGRVARTSEGVRGQLVHPRSSAAGAFAEYVKKLIAELERAP